jgi:hypothetical protein
VAIEMTHCDVSHLTVISADIDRPERRNEIEIGGTFERQPAFANVFYRSWQDRM